MTQAGDIVRPRSTASRVASGALVIVGGLVWAGGIGMFMVVVPPFEEIYSKFEISGGIPAATLFCVSMGKILASVWPLLAIAWLVVVSLLAVACVSARWRGGHLAAILFAAVSLVAVPTGAIVVGNALLTPVAGLIQTVGSDSPQAGAPADSSGGQPGTSEKW
jgi:hypothetical protein